MQPQQQPPQPQPAGLQPLEFDMENVTPATSAMGGSTGRAGGAAVSERDEKLKEAAELMLGTADDWEGYVGIVRPGGPNKTQYKPQYLKLANGSLQFYKPRKSGDELGPLVRQDLIRAIRSIRWSGVEVDTPLEKFRMYYSPGKKTATPEDPEKTHRMFQALGKYHDSKKSEPELKSEFVESQGLNGCMQVGELGDGRVIYRPAEGMHDEERDNDILRLAIAINLVEEEALKAELAFTGWVAKSSRGEGGGRNKERYLKVGDGHLYFHDDARTVKPRKMIGVATIKNVQCWQLTIVTEYDTFKLCNASSNPGALESLVKKLQATHALITGDVLRSYSTAFDAFDKDNDGTLTREEILQYLGDAELVEQFFREIDVNDDGSISRDEFMRAVEERQRTFMGEDGKLQRVQEEQGVAEAAAPGSAAADSAPPEAAPPGNGYGALAGEEMPLLQQQQPQQPQQPQPQPQQPAGGGGWQASPGTIGMYAGARAAPFDPTGGMWGQQQQQQQQQQQPPQQQQQQYGYSAPVGGAQQQPTGTTTLDI